MKPDTRKIAALAGALATLGTECQGLRSSVTRLGTGPEGFEGDVAYMRRASDALCRMSRIERAVLTDPGAQVTQQDEERIRCDLRAHLGTLKGYGELILEELAADLRMEVAEGTEELLTDIVARADGLLPLVDRLRRTGDHGTPEPAEPEDAPSAEGPALGGARVLVIDDDPQVRQTLLELLGNYRMDCVSVTDGRAGLRTLESERVDVVLCGVSSPEMSGAEFLKQVKANEATAHIPVLMMAEPSEDTIVARCLISGAADFIGKPIRPVVLAARLGACLAARRIADARSELEAAIESIPEGFAVYDRFRRLRSCNHTYRQLNPGLEELTQTADIALEQLLRANWEKGLYRASGEPDADFAQWCRVRVEHHTSARPHMERLAGNRWVEIVHSRMPTGGVVVRQREVTARHREEERLRYLLFHDPVTALPNASKFEIQVRHATEEGPFALIVFDLDGWQPYRVAKGHEAANRLLKTAAQVMLDSVRAGDFVAHLGGASFAMILYRVSERDRADELTGRICDLVKPALAAETAGVIGVRAGIALSPADGRRHAQLLDVATTSLMRI